jgi:nucleolar protein 56
MEIFAWFGRIDQETGSFSSAGGMQEMVQSLLLREGEPAPSYQPDLRSLARDCLFAASDRQYNSQLREVALELVRRQLQAVTTAEQDLLQAVEALDDLTQALNLLDERLYEWSRLHHQEIIHGKDIADALCDDANMGELAKAVLSLRESRKSLEREVGCAAESIAPNLSILAGPVLAARLISRAGGLQRMMRMPSCAIQVMGAEKSLFKHLKGNAPSPKHGIIYRHPAIMGSAKRLRGRAARALAGKLAIAARMDYFGSGPSIELQESLERRLAEVKRRGKSDSGRKT